MWGDSPAELLVLGLGNVLGGDALVLALVERPRSIPTAPFEDRTARGLTSRRTPEVGFGTPIACQSRRKRPDSAGTSR
jgi:hypothetical protein